MAPHFFEVCIKGETASIELRDGKVFCEGYIVENEKLALELTRFGEGIGVFIVALDEVGNVPNLDQQIALFNENLNDIAKSTLSWTQDDLSLLTWAYLAYSPHLNLRLEVAANGALPNSLWRRFYADTDVEIISEALTNRNSYGALTKEMITKLATHSNPDVRWALCWGVELPLEIQVLLANDVSVPVRINLVSNRALNNPVMRILAKDPDISVRQALLERSYLPRDIVITLAHDTESIRRKLINWLELDTGKIDSNGKLLTRVRKISSDLLKQELEGEAIQEVAL